MASLIPFSHPNFPGFPLKTPDVYRAKMFLAEFRWIRHPMYAAIWLFGLSQGLLLENRRAQGCLEYLADNLHIMPLCGAEFDKGLIQ
jgi:hypothetical protein